MIFRRLAVILLFLLNCVFSINAFAQGDSIKLHAETWDVPRHGEVLLNIPELSTIVRQWMENTQQNIELRYPGGEEGELWVEELKGWLVSLGVPSNVILLSPGSEAEDIINMVLIEAVKSK